MPHVYQVPAQSNISHQELKSIKIDNLKCLKNVEIDFSEKPMIAIMAPNGCGKSSILHALYCSFNIPNTSAEVNHFSRFFRPTNLNNWNNSKFTIEYSYQTRGVDSGIQRKEYRKTQQRWCRYETRPIRHTEFIGIETCVPSIEHYASKRGSTLNKSPLTTEEDIKVRDTASKIMLRKYTEYCKRTTKSKKLIGVKYSDIEYSSFSMGAGEQRIFFILEKIIKAPKYSLILVDEIDLLLHEDALSRLLDEINKICNNKKLQLIFTTHSRSVLSKDYIAFRNLYQTKDRTLCLEKSYPEFLSRLSGKREQMYEIFVEDELARTIVQQLCIDNGVKPNVDIIKFGPAIVGVNSACGMVVTDFNNMDRSLFVTDGDKEHFDDKWYDKQVKKYFEGDDPDLGPKREMALKLITRFNMIDNHVAPEEYYRNCILGLNRELLTEGEKSIYDALQNVVLPADTHDYFKTAIENLGLSLETGTWEIIKLLKKTGQWGQITERVQQWIDSIRQNIVIPENNERQLPN